MSRIVVELNALSGARIRLVPVTNRFFGDVTTVSGLLTGQDVVGALRDQALGDLVVLPRAMFTGNYGSASASPGMTLDDMSVAGIWEEVGVPVAVAGTMAEVLEALGSGAVSPSR
jgi:NifB/MoaA-like Fe-S oxidoreductase